MTNAFDGINDLRDGGTLSQKLDGYTERPAQLELAQLVAESLQLQQHAVVEAGTGTGKSLGYLLPTVRDGKVAIISTANKALQEQLFYKDIPFVQKQVQPFPAALVKGFSNYFCHDRMNEAVHNGVIDPEHAEMQELIQSLEDGQWDGDFESPGAPTLSDEIRQEVRADRDACAWQKCPCYQECYVRKMRQNAQTAKVIVVNHTTLMLDALTGGKVLPEHDVVIIDEAHHLEEEATSVFTTSVKDLSVYALCALRRVREVAKEKLLNEIVQLTRVLWIMLEGQSLNERVFTNPIQDGLRLASLVGQLAKDLDGCVPAKATEKDMALHQKLVKRAENLSADLRRVFSVADRHRNVYYLETTLKGRQKIVEAKAAPLEVSTHLRKHLFSQGPVICTSATLAAGDLSYFKRRVGLDRPKERILPLVFDYRKSALLYLPKHLPVPAYRDGALDYQKAIAQEMLRLVRASRGRAFLLFSSKKMLEAVYAEIGSELSAEYPVVCQGRGQSRAEMTREFREKPGSVLFGLKSFWEGVDIAGDALSLVVIDKLPFTPPDDPVHEARVNLMKEAGEDWFGTSALPQTVLLLKQGVGRLIRTHADRGVMAILDTRMHTKPYGKRIVGALPPAHVTTSLRDVERFFGTAGCTTTPQEPRQVAKISPALEKSVTNDVAKNLQAISGAEPPSQGDTMLRLKAKVQGMPYVFWRVETEHWPNGYISPREYLERIEVCRKSDNVRTRSSAQDDIDYRLSR